VNINFNNSSTRGRKEQMITANLVQEDFQDYSSVVLCFGNAVNVDLVLLF